MSKLRIAYLSCGTFGHIEPYLRFFKARGHEVSWIVYDRPDHTCDVRTIDISHGANADRSITKWKYMLAGISIRKVLREIAPDLLHGHYVTSAGMICFLSRFRPYVLSARGTDLIGTAKSSIWRALLRKVLCRAALVHTVSEQLKTLALTLGVSSEHVMVGTQGVDLGIYCYQPPGRLGSPVRLLCTRMLGETYNPFPIVLAGDILRRQGLAFTLTFAAGGPLQSRLEQIVEEKGLSGCVRFMGGYRNQDLPGLLRKHDIYISASLWDGTSISLLEAMACGIFPVVSRIASNQAWVEDGKTALLFACGNPQDLAGQIIRAVEDNALRTSAIEQNRQVIEERGNRIKNMEALESRYYEIVGRRP